MIGNNLEGCFQMSISSISSISTSPPVKSPDPVQSKATDIQNNDVQNNAAQSSPAPSSSAQNPPSNDNDDASEAPKPTPAPLPPGQGTRIDQLV